MTYPDLILQLEYLRSSRAVPPTVSMKTLENGFEIAQKCTPPPRSCIRVSYTGTVDSDATTPPHLELLEAAGDRLKFLSFRKENRSFYRTFMQHNGFCLDHIFKYCTSLTTLILSRDFRFIDCNQGHSKAFNKSISTLELKHCGISPRSFSEFSVRLPNLKHLLLNCFWFTDLEKTNNDYTLEISNMTLHSLIWEGIADSSTLDNRDIHVKLVTPNKTSCFTYIVTLGKFSKFTDIEFRKSWDKNETLCRNHPSINAKSVCFLIQCLDIKAFEIVLGFPKRRIEFPLDQDCDAYYSSP